MDEKQYSKEYYLANRETRLKKIKEYREANVDIIRHKDRMRNKQRDERHNDLKSIARLSKIYNTTKEIATDLFKRSMRSCEVCGTEWNPSLHKHRFCVDHSHTTGEIRGILCHHCNAALGHLRENDEIILALLEYNRKHNGQIYKNI